MYRILDVHEDDEGTAEIDLLSNYVAYPGNKWDIADAQVYSPANVRDSFITANIGFSETRQVLNEKLPKFARIVTGRDTESQEHENIVAYGSDDSFAIVLEHDGTLVTGIWFVLHDITEQGMNAIKALFTFLSAKGSFLFTDHEWDFQCKTDELVLFEKYCENKFGHT